MNGIWHTLQHWFGWNKGHIEYEPVGVGKAKMVFKCECGRTQSFRSQHRERKAA